MSGEAESVSAIVGRHVALRKQGREFRGPCPFHENDEQEALFVNDRQGWYHCFGCLAHGDGPKFLREMEKIAGGDRLGQD